MKNPKTSYEVLVLLETYHQQRRDTYAQLATRATDRRGSMLLDRLTELEEIATTVISGEISRLRPDHSTFLPSGPTLTIDPAHAMDCHCDSHPTFDEALGCALTSDEALDELIDRLANSSAAPSVQDLAKRLRELERTKDRQITNFSRED